tara:strand:- start:31 stop:282 length:252 start_codon:yes stop_codon:yes gene_type:complete
MVLFQRTIILIFTGNSFVNGQAHYINFNGSNDYIVIFDHVEFDLTQNFTLGAWIFPGTFSKLAGIISKYHTPAANGHLIKQIY